MPIQLPLPVLTFAPLQPGTPLCKCIVGIWGLPAFWAGHGITQGEPLSAKLFDILVDAVRKGMGVAYGRRVS